MKYIKRKYIPLDKGMSGNIMDTENTTNIRGNAPSIRLVKEMIKNDSGSGDGILTNSVIEFDSDYIPEGYEEVDNPNTYSTEEQVIGTWIDGKKIYRKIINIDEPEKEKSITYTHNLGISTHVNSSMYLLTGASYDNCVKANFYGNTPAEKYAVVIFGETPSSFAYYLGSGWTDNIKLRVILEYTKTTD